MLYDVYFNRERLISLAMSRTSTTRVSFICDSDTSILSTGSQRTSTTRVSFICDNDTSILSTGSQVSTLN